MRYYCLVPDVTKPINKAMPISRLILTTILSLTCLFSVAVTAADIKLQSLMNEPVLLNEFIGNGQFTLVMIWAIDCAPCEEQKPMIQQFHSDFHKGNANVIGVVIDGYKHIDKVNKLINEQAPSYDNYLADPTTFLSDFASATGKQFTGAPTYILYDGKGDVMAVAFGPITRAQLDDAISPSLFYK